MSKTLAHREGVRADLVFVEDSWRRSYWRSHFAGPFSHRVFDDIYRAAIQDILMRSKVIVAYMPGEDPPDDLYGWMAYEPEARWTVRLKISGRWGDVEMTGPCVHYVNVKEDFRRQGVGRSLFRAAGINANEPWIYTSRTDIVSRILDGRNPAKFLPTYLRTRLSQMEDRK